MDITSKKSKSHIENNPSKTDLELSSFKSTLKLKSNPNQSPKSQISVKLEKKVILEQSKPKVEKTTKNINQVPQIQAPLLSITQWILVIYSIIFLALIISAISLEWSSIWQIPKSLIFILGVTGFLFLTSVLWIFGQIRHIVAITLGDILFILTGLAVVIITFINPNRIAFWGSTNRIFDAGIFVVFLVLLFILLKLFLEKKSIYTLVLLMSVLIILSAGLGAVAIYIPDVVINFSILTQLQPSYTWLTESPQELGLITLITVNLIFLIVSKIKTNNVIKLLISSFYYSAFLVHILILIRLSNDNMYILTILTIIIHTIFYIKSISHSTKLKEQLKFIASRASLISGIVIIALLYIIIVRPFQDNTNFSEYSIIANPNLNLSINIAQQSLQSDTWFGSSNIMYAWNRFAPADINLEISNFSFETLSNELINIGVKNGLVVTILLILFALWVLFSILRIVLIQKTFPIELYILVLAITGIFSMPFTIVSKILFILILILWSNIFTKYFKPVVNLNLDINKIPASVSSLFTFVILFTIAGSLLASNKIYNIFKSQEYIVKASQVQNNLAEQVDLLAKAQSKSPYMIEYGNLYIQALIKQINEQAIELSNSEEANIDAEKQKNLQDNIAKAQELIDEYKSKFAMDSRVIYWQLDLYSITHRYGKVDENLYLSNIARGRDLKPQSQDWDIYEAQYYARQSQKGQELNSEQLEQAKAILDDTIKKNQFSTEAYKNYYELLALSDDYKGQIDLLEKYVNIMLEKDRLVDQELVYLLGVAYQNNQQYTEALAVYNKLLETFPDYTNVYFKLGELYEAQKNTDLAIQNYNKVLELDPNAEAARLKLEQIQ
jgi:tetratricopeptide (TPR) repeat protein